ncbi:phosphoadenosine phosphosulfate reductase domain-containing protein, partial [Staphylococcus epidermidis]|uniref:phosphoadenosine phosphosulfate reductase domain-containing protein n=1 Tax=Staphylococcus epidermidis TaxID=1282 RepID=UPI0037DA06FA
MHFISQIKPHPQILFLHTHLHFQQTYHLIHTLKHKYPQLPIKIKKPQLTLQRQA